MSGHHIDDAVRILNECRSAGEYVWADLLTMILNSHGISISFGKDRVNWSYDACAARKQMRNAARNYDAARKRMRDMEELMMAS